MQIKRLVGLNIVDDDMYQSYRDAMMPILKSYGGNFEYDFKILEVLKSKTNDPINRVFLISFLDKDSMNLFFVDKKYLKVKQKYFEKSVTHMTQIAIY